MGISKYFANSYFVGLKTWAKSFFLAVNLFFETLVQQGFSDF